MECGGAPLLFDFRMKQLCSLGNPLDLFQRCWVFQGRRVAEFLAEIGRAHNATHDFCVSCFWDVAYEQNFFWRERLAEMGGEHVF